MPTEKLLGMVLIKPTHFIDGIGGDAALEKNSQITRYNDDPMLSISGNRTSNWSSCSSKTMSADLITLLCLSPHRQNIIPPMFS
jgi:hypothetical protein